MQFFLLIEGEIIIQGSVMSYNGKRGKVPLTFKSFLNGGNFHQVLCSCLDSPLLLLKGLNIRISKLLFTLKAPITTAAGNKFGDLS